MDASTSPPPTARPRSTRDRPAKAPLSEAAIVDAALAITKAEGFDAVTMRRIAAELDTGAASLYVYVRNRDELLWAMFERAAGTLTLVEPDPAHWREQVHEMLGSFLATLESYPGLAHALPVGPPSTESALAGAESLFGILLAGGIATQDAAWACDILALIVTATAIEADTRRVTASEDREDIVERMRTRFSGLPPERFPNLVAHAEEMTAGDGADRFRFAIDTFLDGLVARSSSR
ncbi:MAG: TetR/AcrR family transcriptional regulator C-terminal domain-containing protein [Actinobacteria bacterium]|nr:TetR/AcrR family transcriptional regulator C-terminal domain-containing protein [Actinomycetota bacterium]